MRVLCLLWLYSITQYLIKNFNALIFLLIYTLTELQMTKEESQMVIFAFKMAWSC